MKAEDKTPNLAKTETHTFWLTVVLTAMVTITVSLLYIQLVDPTSKNPSEEKEDLRPTATQSSPDLKQLAELRVPDLEALPDDEFGKSVRRGKALLENTKALLPKHVGANMSCTNCHLNSGTKKFAIPWVGVAARFPQYRSRTGKMDTLQERINDCFERSLNGRALAVDSPEMTDMVSYMTWLSVGYPIGQKVEGSGVQLLKLDRQPNLEIGKTLYDAKCAACHKANGEGHYDNNSKKSVFPPLWGETSFNIGAGMARLHTAAGFIKQNMPQGQEGSLTDDEAYDIAAYFTQRDRPGLAKSKLDWPKGEKPHDARY